jgi:hypothetical protein
MNLIISLVMGGLIIVFLYFSRLFYQCFKAMDKYSNHVWEIIIIVAVYLIIILCLVFLIMGLTLM